MNSQAGWYWMAVGVFALGLTNNLANGGARKLEATAEHTVQFAQEVSDRIAGHTEYLAMMLSGTPEADIQVQTAVRSLEHNVACQRVQVIRQQAAFSRLQAAQFRAIRLEIPKPKFDFSKIDFKRADCSGVNLKRDKI